MKKHRIHDMQHLNVIWRRKNEAFMIFHELPILTLPWNRIVLWLTCQLIVPLSVHTSASNISNSYLAPRIGGLGCPRRFQNSSSQAFNCCSAQTLHLQRQHSFGLSGACLTTELRMTSCKHKNVTSNFCTNKRNTILHCTNQYRIPRCSACRVKSFLDTNAKITKAIQCN